MASKADERNLNPPVSDETDYEQLIDDYTHFAPPHDGELLQGRVVKLHDKDVIVDFGYKSEGLVPIEQFSQPDGSVHVQVGDQIDVMVDRLTMCHTLDFRPSFGRLPLTVDSVDVLLSKLQIVELNEKDARDIFHLLAGLPIGEGAPPMMDTGRFGKVLGADWGWWRTVTENLAKLPALLAEKPGLAPPAPRFDPLAQARQLLDLAESTPKGVKWKIRANVGDRVRWYELPEEVAH